MNTLNLILFGLYMVVTVVLGVWVGRRHAANPREYFLAGEGLPWYAIGGSIIAANISTEHFIGMVGIAYAVGFVVAQWEWGNVITFSALIWIFLPFYIRGGLYTMPEFLERRYNAHCRYFFAVCCLVLWIVAQMAVVMLAGAKAMRGMFDINETATIVALALLAGSYTIYGGLRSVAWTDFLQFVVMMLGGLLVAGIGLAKVGGLGALMHAAPEKFKIAYRPFFGQHKSDHHMVAVGRWSAFLILLIATLLAVWFTRRQMGVFMAIQNIGAWVAAPIASLFLVGVMWKRATAAAAMFVLWFGFPFTAFVEHVLFRHVAALRPFDNWLNRTFVVWLACMALMVIVSLFTRAPSPEKLAGIIWSPKMAALPAAERLKYGGWRSLFLWWAIFAGLVVALYLYLFYFQFFGPAKGH